MANKINFITGETYTLAELFSENRFVIIPDLQRDYCWGTDGQELVLGFINSLVEQYKKQPSDELNLGLLYGYETPANHIQLCDGQQRITTLFLLLGMLNRSTGIFQRNLISDFEYEHDDKEPYLSYAIRESSLYFLRDLVSNFFIGNSPRGVDFLRTTDWYFSDYDLDPSIQSMLAALKTIEKLLATFDEEFSMGFGRYLLNKLTFQYYDMENRANGEETFVVINTTGEPLTASQNLKPLIMEAEINKNTDRLSERWEEMEHWFWKKRRNGNDTADAGVEEFLRWVALIEKKEDKKLAEELLRENQQNRKIIFPYESIPFQTISDYWQALQLLVAWNEIDLKFLSPNKGSISSLDCFRLLPRLYYVKKYYEALARKDDDAIQTPREYQRVREFFKNLARTCTVRNRSGEFVCDAIKMVDFMQDGEILSLLDCDETLLSKALWTDEERLKLFIINEYKEVRCDIEQAFWKAQEHPILAGEILPLIEWATQDGRFDYTQFEKYRLTFNRIFEGDCKDNIDIVRRALLTLELYGYPRIFRGYTNISFGCEWEYWKDLIKDNKDKFKRFFDRLINGELLEQMIDAYDGESEWKRFIKEPELLAYCKEKNVQRSGNDLLLLRGKRTSGEYKTINDFFA